MTPLDVIAVLAGLAVIAIFVWDFLTWTDTEAGDSNITDDGNDYDT